MTAPDPPSEEPTFRPRFERTLFGRSLTPRRAARLIAVTTLLLTVVGGIAVRVFDRKEFDSIGDSLWWALQTVTTVGYGDVVPERATGRIVGAFLMLNGIALVSVITAAVTAVLIEQTRRRRAASEDEVIARLDAIEARLAEIAAASRREDDA